MCFMSFEVVALLIVFGPIQLCALLSSSIDTLSQLSFEAEQKFLRVNISYPSTPARVFGLFEFADSSIVFELKYGENEPVLNLPAPDIDLSLKNATHRCNNIKKQLNLNIEIELATDAITVRSKNAEQYYLLNSLIPNEHFRLLFFAVPQAKTSAICVLPATTLYRSRSENKLPSMPSNQISSDVGYKPSKVPTTKRSRFNNNLDTSTLATVALRRATTLRTAFERRVTTDRYRDRVRFATFKQAQLGLPTKVPPMEPHYIDISKDKETYEQVQRSSTREINSAWSVTFILFFSLVALVVGIFTCFGLAMFVLLQCRPRNHEQLKPVSFD